MHPIFYVGHIRPYCQYEPSSYDEDISHAQDSLSDTCDNAPEVQSDRVVKRPLHSTYRSPFELSPARLFSDIPLDLKLWENVISTIFRTKCLTILSVIPHRTGRSVASVSLVLQIIVQFNDCAIRLGLVEMVSRTTWGGVSSSSTSFGGITR